MLCYSDRTDHLKEGDVTKSVTRRGIDQCRLSKEENQKYLRELVEVIETGDTKKVRRLLWNGINLRETYRYMFSPLHIASILGYFEICKLLLEHGADTNEVFMDDGVSSLTLACNNGHLDIARYRVSIFIQHYRTDPQNLYNFSGYRLVLV